MPRTRSGQQLFVEEKQARRREQKKISARRARAKMSEAEVEERRKKDRERYKKKKEKGLMKTINDYTPREQRAMRKKWREKAKIKREKSKKNDTTNNDTPTSSRSRRHVGKARAARNRRTMKTENKNLQSYLHKLQTRLAKYRMRLVRLKKKLPLCDITKNTTTSHKPKKNIEIRNKVHTFLTQDEHSRLTAGKKETITRNKNKRQIRLLNDSLLNLHKKFVLETNCNISYQTFRRNRPFWVIIPKVASRSTCLCAIHTNNNFIVKALFNAKIINFKSATDVLKSQCCNDSLDLACLEGRCPGCKVRTIQLNEYNGNDSIMYEKWLTKNVTVVIKGKSKICKKTVKENITTTKEELVTIFESCIPEFALHVGNNIHQIRTIKSLKQLLTPSEGLLHIDFSENYNCKYGEEIQSAHFGGSKPQVSLHTCVYYSAEADPPTNFITTTSICTIAENLRHDPVMICVHLIPIFKRIQELSPKLQHLHILSDGPSTQYRNKTMFHLIAKHLSQKLNLETITWHYSEKGHGKGAPDGVGGCIKRLCDNAVARGNDVSNFDALMACVKSNCKNIEVYGVDDSKITEIQDIVNAATTKPFKGTFKIHQLTWSSRQQDLIHARRLSCLTCAAHTVCKHFEIGQIDILCKTPDSPVDAVSPSLIPTPTPNHTPSKSFDSPVTPKKTPNNPPMPHTPRTPSTIDMSPEIAATPDAPTVPNTPTTPENLYNGAQESTLRRSMKRLFSSDDSSPDIFIPKRKKTSPPRRKIDFKDSSPDIFIPKRKKTSHPRRQIDFEDSDEDIFSLRRH